VQHFAKNQKFTKTKIQQKVTTWKNQRLPQTYPMYTRLREMIVQKIYTGDKKFEFTSILENGTFLKTKT
jgi:hypothetical protein